MILDISGNPIGRNVIPLGIALEFVHRPGEVRFRVRPTRWPVNPQEVAFLENLMHEGMTVGYKLTLGDILNLAKTARGAARIARKAARKHKVPGARQTGHPMRIIHLTIAIVTIAIILALWPW